MVALTWGESPRGDHNFGPDIPTAIAAIAPATTIKTVAIHQRSRKPLLLVGAFATFVAVPALDLAGFRLLLSAICDASSLRAALTGSRALTLSGVGEAMRSRTGALEVSLLDPCEGALGALLA